MTSSDERSGERQPPPRGLFRPGEGRQGRLFRHSVMVGNYIKELFIFYVLINVGAPVPAAPLALGS